jgi:tricorn protease
VRKVDVEIPSDLPLTRSRYPDAAQTLTSFTLSPKGDRLAVVTRGEIFAIPVKDGPTMPVTQGSAARERGAAFSPDGKRLAYITDAAGEEEIRTIDAWGRGDSKVVKPAGKSGYHFRPSWSPDGRWIAYADEKQSLYTSRSVGAQAGGSQRSGGDHRSRLSPTVAGRSPMPRTDYFVPWTTTPSTPLTRTEDPRTTSSAWIRGRPLSFRRARRIPCSPRTTPT